VAKAPGYEAAQATVNVPNLACNPGALPASVTLTLMPSCTSPVMHEDAFGDSWSDCTATGTYDQGEGIDACMAQSCGFDDLQCELLPCSPPDGGKVYDLAVCGGAPTCHCWMYSGPAAGHARESDAGCECATTSDPTWQ
jgi:hypothetical protein